MNDKCQQHQTVFFAVCGFFVFVFSVLVVNVVANENRNIDRANLYIKDSISRRDVLQERMSEGFMEIKQRLSRIEAKLDTK